MLAMYSAMALISGGLAYLFLHIDFVPYPASVERGLIDNFIQVLLAIAGVFFGVIITVLGYSLIFFRRRKGDESDARPIRGNPFLELSWTIIPLAVILVISVYGAVVLDRMDSPGGAPGSTKSIFSLGAFVPGKAAVNSGNTSQTELVVNVTASRFAWQFYYPDYDINSYLLEVPVDVRIRFDIQSKDVVHSFWVQAWGPKQDAVPGLTPVLRITPTEIGQFLVQCSQLCGTDHTDMTAPVSVVSAADFETWVTQQQAMPSGSATTPTGHTMIDLVAQNLAFNQTTITVPAGAEVMINFDNKDNGIPHNFSLYTDSTASKAIFVGQIITGPSTITYAFAAPTAPGTYFFRCDVHPTMMTGTFIVQ
jgi:cytochrome c oxidase subunit II